MTLVRPPVSSSPGDDGSRWATAAVVERPLAATGSQPGRRLDPSASGGARRAGPSVDDRGVTDRELHRRRVDEQLRRGQTPPLERLLGDDSAGVSTSVDTSMSTWRMAMIAKCPRVPRLEVDRMIVSPLQARGLSPCYHNPQDG